MYNSNRNFPVRRGIERIIKEKQLDRRRIFEASKSQYEAIINKIQNTLAANEQSEIPCVCRDVRNEPIWYHALRDIKEQVYVLFEDTDGCREKYWLYEMYCPELITVLDELSELRDYYIVSKKFRWLIGEDHEEVVRFLGRWPEYINQIVFLS